MIVYTFTQIWKKEYILMKMKTHVILESHSRYVYMIFPSQSSCPIMSIERKVLANLLWSDGNLDFKQFRPLLLSPSPLCLLKKLERWSFLAERGTSIAAQLQGLSVTLFQFLGRQGWLTMSVSWDVSILGHQKSISSGAMRNKNWGHSIPPSHTPAIPQYWNSIGGTRGHP